MTSNYSLFQDPFLVNQLIESGLNYEQKYIYRKAQQPSNNTTDNDTSALQQLVSKLAKQLQAQYQTQQNQHQLQTQIDAIKDLPSFLRSLKSQGQYGDVISNVAYDNDPNWKSTTLDDQKIYVNVDKLLAIISQEEKEKLAQTQDTRQQAILQQLYHNLTQQTQNTFILGGQSADQAMEGLQNLQIINGNFLNLQNAQRFATQYAIIDPEAATYAQKVANSANQLISILKSNTLEMNDETDRSGFFTALQNMSGTNVYGVALYLLNFMTALKNLYANFVGKYQGNTDQLDIISRLTAGLDQAIKLQFRK